MINNKTNYLYIVYFFLVCKKLSSRIQIAQYPSLAVQMKFKVKSIFENINLAWDESMIRRRDQLSRLLENNILETRFQGHNQFLVH